jgi:hypothetical protein
MNDASLDDILDQLKSSNTVNNNKNAEESQENLSINDDNLGDFLVQNAAKVIKDSVDSIQILKQTLYQSEDPEEVVAFSELVKASTTALEVLNKIHIQNKKNKHGKEMRQLEIESRKELETLKKPNINNTNILLSTREDLFKRIIDEVKKPQTIEIIHNIPIEATMIPVNEFPKEPKQISPCCEKNKED